MCRKDRICILIVMTLIIYGICFIFVKTDFLINIVESDKNPIGSPNTNFALQDEIKSVDEISSLDPVKTAILKKLKSSFRIKIKDSNRIFNLFHFQPKFQHYLINCVEIMADNSSLAQRAIIQYLYTQDGAK